jgi:sterol 3beta-glucosyltransferase
MIPSAAHEAAPDVLVRASVPHADVLPRVSVAIHHGGAGTVHSALRAGVPSVIIPFLGDQPWWARHLHQRGLGPQALPRKTTRYQDIAYVLVKAKSYRDAVKLASLQMATEDGLAKALEIMEQAEAGIHPFRAA